MAWCWSFNLQHCAKLCSCIVSCVLQAAAEKLHQQLSLVDHPHSFLIRQLAAAEATAAAAQAELAAAKVCNDLACLGFRLHGVAIASCLGCLLSCIIGIINTNTVAAGRLKYLSCKMLQSWCTSLLYRAGGFSQPLGPFTTA
jgi:hypothetical protein